MDKIRQIKYPAYWRIYRIVFIIANVLILFLAYTLFMHTGTVETVYEEQEVTRSPASLVGQNLSLEEFQNALREPQIRIVPRQVTTYPAITWLVLVIGIISFVFYFIADIIFWRCMNCDSPFWFWMRRSWLQFFANNCPRCGAEIAEMYK